MGKTEGVTTARRGVHRMPIARLTAIDSECSRMWRMQCECGRFGAIAIDCDNNRLRANASVCNQFQSNVTVCSRMRKYTSECNWWQSNETECSQMRTNNKRLLSHAVSIRRGHKRSNADKVHQIAGKCKRGGRADGALVLGHFSQSFFPNRE